MNGNIYHQQKNHKCYPIYTIHTVPVGIVSRDSAGQLNRFGMFRCETPYGKMTDFYGKMMDFYRTMIPKKVDHSIYTVSTEGEREFDRTWSTNNPKTSEDQMTQYKLGKT